jgi:hypothetical protein
MNYNNRRFKPISVSDNGEVSQETIFVYKQHGSILTSEYSGGDIIKGHIIGLVDEKGNINMRYQQISKKGVLMTGICHSKPVNTSNGKLQLHEYWQWTSGDKSKGESILEEV